MTDSRLGVTIRIDPHRCVGNAMCARAVPGVFVLDEETRIAELHDSDEVTMKQLFEGARACPTQAIIIEQFGRRIYPQILTPMFGDREDENSELSNPQ